MRMFLQINLCMLFLLDNLYAPNSASSSGAQQRDGNSQISPRSADYARRVKECEAEFKVAQEAMDREELKLALAVSPKEDALHLQAEKEKMRMVAEEVLRKLERDSGAACERVERVLQNSAGSAEGLHQRELASALKAAEKLGVAVEAQKAEVARLTEAEDEATRLLSQVERRLNEYPRESRQAAQEKVERAMVALQRARADLAERQGA